MNFSEERPVSLTDEERERYRRQLTVPGWDQERLKAASVFVAGVGGLGGLSALYLALAGVGRIRLADRDKVEPSNLNRQVLYDETSLGRAKVEEAGRRLRLANPHIGVETSSEPIGGSSLEREAAGAALILDGLDNLETRFLVNAYSVANQVPYLYGAVRGWQGMVGLFHPPWTACLACLLSRENETEPAVPIFGCLPGTIGLLQATEALKYLMGLEPALRGRLLIYDGRDMTFDIVEVVRNPNCPVCSGRKA
jgi:molybdopterin/thiamine biosynthesis adenylyltransferase